VAFVNQVLHQVMTNKAACSGHQHLLRHTEPPNTNQSYTNL
jgi:hypothetical protein